MTRSAAQGEERLSLAYDLAKQIAELIPKPQVPITQIAVLLAKALASQESTTRRDPDTSIRDDNKRLRAQPADAAPAEPKLTTSVGMWMTLERWNPGGQVMCVPMPNEIIAQVPETDRTRLLTREDVQRIWPDAKSISEHEEEQARVRRSQEGAPEK